MKLAEILDRNELSVLDHLEREVTVPVIDGPQAQGDLIVLPLSMMAVVTVGSWTYWQPVPRQGIELVRGVAGNNPHTLVANGGACQWTRGFRDPLRLGVALFENTAPVYLIHPEHGGSGVAPGRWLVRRQQESGRHRRMLVAD